MFHSQYCVSFTIVVNAAPAAGAQTNSPVCLEALALRRSFLTNAGLRILFLQNELDRLRLTADGGSLRSHVTNAGRRALAECGTGEPYQMRAAIMDNGKHPET
jgi:hypothetical protein